MRPEKKEMWKCPICYKAHDTERECDLCIYGHVKERCINHDFEFGFNLGDLKRKYALYWNLTEKQEKITNDNCFKISYLQCCDEPAYKISNISFAGEITVSGKGGWSGYYSSRASLDNLKDPRPKEELFIDKR